VSENRWHETDLTRRQVLHGAAAAGVVLGTGGTLLDCGGGSDGDGETSTTDAQATPRRGGKLLVGATGGGAEDTLDAHTPTGDPDAMRVFQLYEPLTLRSPDLSRLEMVLAESIEPEGGRADLWTLRLKPGIEFHDGKPLTADDVIFSIRRIVDKDSPKVGASLIGYIDERRLRKLDDRTLRIPLQLPNAAFPDDIGQYFNGIVPVGYDPAKPIGTGPFRYESFTPGERSVFVRNPNYWRRGQPLVDRLEILNFTEESARVNALLSGQVQAISSLPASQVATVRDNPQLRVVNAETGLWQPFTMRVDQAPFSDVRVRQAFRLMVDRPQLVKQALAGQGRIANDLYAPDDPCFSGDLPQREQDLDHARSLLRAAGRSDLRTELVTSRVSQGIVEAAQVLAEQAKAAGVTMNVRQVDPATYFGPNYLKWTFAQDFWAARTYLVQAAQSMLPDSPFNETHFADERFGRLIAQARAELDEGRRCEIIQDAQRIEHERGGYIIWGFSNQVDGHSALITGIEPARSGFALGSYRLRQVGFVA